MTHIILSVMNSIGIIKVNAFGQYLKQFYIHWVKSFGKVRTMKESLHWSLAHLQELIAKNEGYSMAEYTENSVEALIKRYRFVTNNLARQTSFVDNCQDSLKVLFLQSLHQIRKHENKLKKSNKPKENSESEMINSFFVGEKSYSATGWKRPNLTQEYS